MATTLPQAKPRTREAIFRNLKRVYIAAAAFFVAYYLVHSIRAVEWSTLHFSSPTLVFSIAMQYAGLFVGVICWQKILIGFGYRLPLLETYHIIGRAYMAKYLPGGGAWFVISRVALAEKYGVPRKICIASYFIEFITMLWASSILAVVLLGTMFHSSWLILALTIVLILVGSAVIVTPGVFLVLINFLLRLTKKEPIQVQPHRKQLAEVYLLFLTSALLQGSGYFFFALSFFDHLQPLWSEVVGAFLGSWVLGQVAIPFTGGLGVREFANQRLLSTFMLDGTIATFLATSSRLWMITTEIIFFLLAVLLHRVILMRTRPPVGDEPPGA